MILKQSNKEQIFIDFTPCFILTAYRIYSLLNFREFRSALSMRLLRQQLRHNAT